MVGSLLEVFVMLFLSASRSCSGNETCVSAVIYGGSGAMISEISGRTSTTSLPSVQSSDSRLTTASTTPSKTDSETPSGTAFATMATTGCLRESVHKLPPTHSTTPLCTYQAADPGLGRVNACVCDTVTLQLPVHSSGTRTWAVPTCDYTAFPADLVTITTAIPSVWTEGCQRCSAVGLADKLCLSIPCDSTKTIYLTTEVTAVPT